MAVDIIKNIARAVSNPVVSKGIGLADQAIVDSDNLINKDSALSSKKEDSYQIALQTKTYPLADAIHKLGRQILTLLMMIFGFILAIMQMTETGTVSWEIVSIITGGPGLYMIVKGRGR